MSTSVKDAVLHTSDRESGPAANGNATFDALTYTEFLRSPTYMYNHTDSLFYALADQKWLLRALLESSTNVDQLDEQRTNERAQYEKNYDAAVTPGDKAEVMRQYREWFAASVLQQAKNGEYSQNKFPSFKEMYEAWLTFSQKSSQPTKDEFYSIILSPASLSERRREQQNIVTQFCSLPEVAIVDPHEKAWVLYILVVSDQHNDLKGLLDEWRKCNSNSSEFFSSGKFRSDGIPIQIDLSQAPQFPDYYIAQEILVNEQAQKTDSYDDQSTIAGILDTTKLCKKLHLDLKTFQPIFLEAASVLVNLHSELETLGPSDTNDILQAAMKYLQSTMDAQAFNALLSETNLLSLIGLNKTNFDSLLPIFSILGNSYSQFYLFWLGELGADVEIASQLASRVMTSSARNSDQKVGVTELRIILCNLFKEAQKIPTSKEIRIYGYAVELAQQYKAVDPNSTIEPDKLYYKLLAPFQEPTAQLALSSRDIRYSESFIPDDFPFEAVSQLVASINPSNTKDADETGYALQHFWLKLADLSKPIAHESVLREKYRPLVTQQPLNRIDAGDLEHGAKTIRIDLHPSRSYFFTPRYDVRQEKGLCLSVAEHEMITVISMNGTGDHQVFRPGKYDQVKIQPNTLLYVAENEAVRVIAHISSISPQNVCELAFINQRNQDPLAIVESQMYQKIVEWAEADGQLQTPDFLPALWAASQAFASGPNAGPRLHELERAIVQYERLQQTDEDKILAAEWLDIIRASSRKGWVTTTAEQQLLLKKIRRKDGSESSTIIPKRSVVRRVIRSAALGLRHKLSDHRILHFAREPEQAIDPNEPELGFAEAQKLFNLLYDRVELVASIQASPSFTDEEKQLFRTDEVYSTNSISIWSLSESLLSNILDPDLKRAAHQSLTKYFYSVKAGVIPAPDGKETLVHALTAILPADINTEFLIQTFDKPLTYELVMSRLTDNHEALYRSVVTQFSSAITQNATCTQDQVSREKFDLLMAGRPIDTLRYDPEQQTINLKLTLGRIFGVDHPLLPLLQTTIQSFDLPLPIAIPLRDEAHSELLSLIEFLHEPLSEVPQQKFERTLATWNFLNRLQLPDDKTENPDLIAIIELIAGAAFPTELGPQVPNELAQAARSILIQLHLRYIAEGDIENDTPITPSNAKRILEKISENIDTKFQFMDVLANALQDSDNFAGTAHISAATQISKELQSNFPEFDEYVKLLKSTSQRGMLNRMFKTESSVGELSEYLRELFIDYLHPKKEQGNLDVILSHNLQTIIDAHLNGKMQMEAVAALQKLGLDAKIALLLFHGWGGTGHVFDKIIKALISDIAESKGVIAFAPSIMGSENSASIPHGSGKNITLVQSEQDYQSTSAGLQLMLEVLGLNSKDTVVAGHSMGGLLMMYVALFLPPELWQTVRIKALEPVSQNNDSVTNYVEFLRLMFKHDLQGILAQSSKDAALVHSFIPDSTNAVVNGTLKEVPLKRYLSTLPPDAFRAMTTHIKLLGLDTEGTIGQVLAAMLTDLTTNNDRLKPLLMTEMRDLLTWIGSVGINAACLEAFVKGIPKDIAQVHGYELFTNRDSFLALVTRMLRSTRDLTVDELEYLANLPSSYLQILLGVADNVLKYQPTVVKWQVLIGRMLFAVALANHYAHANGDGLEKFRKMIGDSITELSTQLLSQTDLSTPAPPPTPT